MEIFFLTPFQMAQVFRFLAGNMGKLVGGTLAGVGAYNADVLAKKYGVSLLTGLLQDEELNHQVQKTSKSLCLQALEDTQVREASAQFFTQVLPRLEHTFRDVLIQVLKSDTFQAEVETRALLLSENLMQQQTAEVAHLLSRAVSSEVFQDTSAVWAGSTLETQEVHQKLTHLLTTALQNPALMAETQAHLQASISQLLEDPAFRATVVDWVVNQMSDPQVLQASSESLRTVVKSAVFPAAKPHSL